uniref:Regulator of nonsense transcripts UPF2 n=1 Tax=Rhizophora mucronata TaxID=61149 RepID=A0A2P2L825_RHIMU
MKGFPESFLLICCDIKALEKLFINFLSRVRQSQKNSPLSSKTTQKSQICLSGIPVLQMFQASKILNDINKNSAVFYNSNKIELQKQFQGAPLLHSLQIPVSIKVFPRFSRKKDPQKPLNQAWREVLISLVKQRADLNCCLYVRCLKLSITNSCHSLTNKFAKVYISQLFHQPFLLLLIYLL